MGCNSSFDKVYFSEDFHNWNAQFQALQLTKSEVKRLYQVFRKVDFDGGGTISIAELLTHIDVERSRFSERIFSIFDEDGSGEIDFREFVLSLWNYCTLTKVTLDMFAFDIYDQDHSGELSPSEVKGMLKDIYGSQEAQTNFHAKNILNELGDMSRQGVVLDVDAFRKFVKTHHALLFPAFQMQLYLQKRVLGRRFWEQNADRRIKISRGVYIPISKFLELNVDKRLLEKTKETIEAKSQKMDIRAQKLLSETGTSAKRRQTKGIESDSLGSSHLANVALSKMSAKDLATFGGGASTTNENDVATQSLTEIFNKSGKSGRSQGKASRSNTGKAINGAFSIDEDEEFASTPPTAMATSGKYGTSTSGAGSGGSNTSSSKRRHTLGGAGHAVAFAASGKHAAGSSRDNAPAMYSNNGSGGSSKSKKHNKADPGVVAAPLTMSAVAAKIERSPIEAWQSLPDSHNNNNSAQGAAAAGGGKAGRGGAAVSASEKQNISASGKFRPAKVSPMNAGTGAGVPSGGGSNSMQVVDLEAMPSAVTTKKGSGAGGRRRSVA